MDPSTAATAPADRLMGAPELPPELPPERPDVALLDDLLVARADVETGA